jgi:hypothetical protein
MRTDSPTLSTQAINAARSQAKEMFGEEYVANAPRVYQGKNKNARKLTKLFDQLEKSLESQVKLQVNYKVERLNFMT